MSNVKYVSTTVEQARNYVEILLSGGKEKPVDKYMTRNNTKYNRINILKNCPKNEDLEGLLFQSSWPGMFYQFQKRPREKSVIKSVFSITVKSWSSKNRLNWQTFSEQFYTELSLVVLTFNKTTQNIHEKYTQNLSKYKYFSGKTK